MNKIGARELWHDAIRLAHRHIRVFGAIVVAAILLPALVLRFTFADFYDSFAGFDPAAPPVYPPGLLLATFVVVLVQMFCLYAVITMAADPDEGRDVTPGEIAGTALKGFGKTVLAYLLLYIVSIVVMFVLALVIALLLVGGVWVTGYEFPASTGGLDPLAVGIFSIFGLIFAGLSLWVGCRLAPLPGVYVSEESGIIEGIRRAWTLSRGSAGAILRGLLLPLPLFVLLAIPQLLMMSGQQMNSGVSLAIQLVAGIVGAALYLCFACWLGLLYRRLAG